MTGESCTLGVPRPLLLVPIPIVGFPGTRTRGTHICNLVCPTILSICGPHLKKSTSSFLLVQATGFFFSIHSFLFFFSSSIIRPFLTIFVVALDQPHQHYERLSPYTISSFSFVAEFVGVPGRRSYYQIFYNRHFWFSTFEYEQFSAKLLLARTYHHDITALIYMELSSLIQSLSIRHRRTGCGLDCWTSRT